MKKLSVSLFLFIIAVTYSYSQNNEDYYSLDGAIKKSVENMDERLGRNDSGGIDIPAGQKPVVAILNFNSPSEELSSYVVEELTLALAGNIRFIIVDRQRLDLIRQEENFQLSGEVSDESAQAIGKKLGAQYVVTGTLSDMGDSYRFRIMALIVETAAISSPTSVNIQYDDRRIVSLLAKKNDENRRIAALQEAKQQEEERSQKERERQRKWEAIKKGAYLNMIQFSGLAFQSDKDFSYIFDELGIRWSFLPFTSIG
ncbi:MAG: penicillin-binding protein activator LpoB, partial [Treponema sp.]|nr:penicillin-binding protein activator LpoB [Treponema sp.]